MGCSFVWDRDVRYSREVEFLKYRYIEFLLVFGFSASWVHGELWEWKSFTPKNQFRCFWKSDSILWAGTEGGLLAFFPQKNTFRTWTNTEGLASNEITAMVGDISGRLWIGFSNGFLQCFDPKTNRFKTFEDLKKHSIHALAIQGDSLFIGSEIGISLFRISRNEIKETYRHLGNRFHTEIPVYDILIMSNAIWTATEEGIARAFLSNVNLMDPENWEDLTSVDGLPSGKIQIVFEWHGEISVGTSKGIYQFSLGAWNLKNGPLPDVQDIVVLDSVFYVATRGGLYREGEGEWIKVEKNLPPCFSLYFDGSFLWIGTENGLYRYDYQTITFEHFHVNSPSGNRFADVEVDQNGMVWCASEFFMGTGFYAFDGNSWKNFSMNTTPWIGSDNFGCVAIDKNNRKWFGAWGEGLLVLENDSTFRRYTTENGYLHGISNALTYAVVSDIAVDSSGTVWLLNFQSVTGEPLIAVTNETQWTYYGISDGFSSLLTDVIAVDLEGKKWIGTRDAGIFVLDDAGTPHDKTDDPPLLHLSTADGLGSNTITALAVDQDGTVWIGTSDGLYYYSYGYIGQTPFYYAEPITALMVDGVNNVWVGTNIGVGYFSNATYTQTHFTTENSPLINNTISCLSYDPIKGTVYIGTPQGLSCIETPFSRPYAKLSTLRVYPNPFFPDRHAWVTIDGLSSPVGITIFSSSGYRLREYSLQSTYGRSILWDGKDAQGNPVSSGIYVIVVWNETDKHTLAKVAVIR